MKSILITGCNRGIGLGLVRHLIQHENPPKCLIATCRDLQKAEELQSIAAKHKNLHILPLDVQHLDSYKEFTKQVSNIVKDDGLNVLFNNAGISSKFTRIQYVKAEQLNEAFSVNTIAPIMLSKSLLPLLKKASDNKPDEKLGVSKATIINMSSVLASIGGNTDGGLYPYRCSKAALNMATVSLSVDLKSDGILVACIHPGWVKTGMGGTKAPMDVDSSSSSIIQLLFNLNESHNGGYFQWDGKKIEW